MDYSCYRPYSPDLSGDYMAQAARAVIYLEQGADSLCLTEDEKSCREILS